MSYAEANYGALTPQDVASDRFGLNQDTELWEPHARYGHKLKTVVSTRLGSPVRRLGLILAYWTHSRYHGATRYELTVHGRPLTITHSRDGRIKLVLDHKTVYEQTRRHRQGQQIIVERYDDSAEEIAHEESLEAVRERLERASAHRHA